ncbi:MAG: hypothetical protein QMC89_01050 [Candidatus Hodarchaeaceae archaeon]|nr:hypothetical protein [Candidatus Hodarchaeaceae archaeon]
MISTKVDQAKYVEFLQYCAKVNKYPANVLRDALELLLNSDKNRSGLPGPEQKYAEVEGTKAKQKKDVDEDEEELFG